MLEDSLKDLPPIKKKRIMKKVDVASYFIQRPLLGRLPKCWKRGNHIWRWNYDSLIFCITFSEFYIIFKFLQSSYRSSIR